MAATGKNIKPQSLPSRIIKKLPAKKNPVAEPKLPASVKRLTKTSRKVEPSSCGPSALWDNEDCLREISSYLGPSDLYSLLTVSRTFYIAAAPILYKNLRLPPGCPCHGPPQYNEDMAAKYSTSVEFFPHSHRTHYSTRLKAPRVRTHIVNYDVADKSTGRDKHDRTTAWGTHKCHNCPKAPPPPERYVLRPTVTAVNRQIYDQRSKHIMVPLGTKSADKTVHISLNLDKNKIRSETMYGPNKKPVTPTKKLTFVILPRYWDCGHVLVEKPGRRTVIRTICSSIVNFIFQHHDHAIRIVGLEDCDPFASNFDWACRDSRATTAARTFDQVLERRLADTWAVKSWSNDDKDRLREHVELMTFREYLESGDWGEEFSWQLVGRWLNALDLRERGLMKTPVLPGSKKPKRKKHKTYDTDSDTDTDITDYSEAEVEEDLRDGEADGQKQNEGEKERVKEEETDEEDYWRRRAAVSSAGPGGLPGVCARCVRVVEVML